MAEPPEASTERPACDQCGKPACYQVGGVPFCLHCMEKIRQLEQEEFERGVALLNYAQQALAIQAGQFGVNLPVPQVRLPVRSVHTGATTLNNIRVEGSTVGAINTGQVQQLDAAVTFYRDVGNSELADALKELTQAVIDSSELEAQSRTDIVELLSHLTQEIRKPSSQRSRSVARSIMAGLKEALSTLTNLSDLWAKVGPLLDRMF